MKQIANIFFLFLMGLSQVSGQNTKRANMDLRIEQRQGRAMDDTLLYFSGTQFSGASIDPIYFQWANEDLDMLPSTYFAVPDAFMGFYSVDSSTNGSGQPTAGNFYFPWETPAVDTPVYWSAISSFVAGGTADDWFEFGPILMPTGSATLNWYERMKTDRNAYSVKISTTGMANYVDFTDPPAYVTFDEAAPSATYTTDTTWIPKSLDISAYAGQLIWVAFHHTSTSMDMLYIDEITILGDTSSFIPCDPSFAIIQDSTDLYNYYIYTGSSGPGYTWFWDFGDGFTSTLPYPTHTYTGSGPYTICLTITRTVDGCTATHCDTLVPGLAPMSPTTVTVVDPTTSVAEAGAQELSALLYPNPATTSATFQVTSPSEQSAALTITDLSGRILFVSDIQVIAGPQAISIDLQNFRAGIYIVQLKTDSSLIRRRMSVIR